MTRQDLRNTYPMHASYPTNARPVVHKYNRRSLRHKVKAFIARVRLFVERH